MEIVVPSLLLAGLLAEAAAAPDTEICGLLFGTPARIMAKRAAANVAADPATSFEIDPAALLAAHRAERAGGPKLIGCYHSHPSGGAEPSLRDLAAAEPGRVWLIIGGGALRGWMAGEGTFRELLLVKDS